MNKVIDLVPYTARQKGEFGVEIEMECEIEPGSEFFDWENVGKWIYHNDGSLRGLAAEYVINKPIDLDAIEGELDTLRERLSEDWRLKITPSIRTSVHTHLNVQELTTQELHNFITAWLIVENVLVEWCGPDRVGNLFCLRTCDAENQVDQLIYLINRGPDWIKPDLCRYAAMNIASIPKFGSIEFRSLQTNENLSNIVPWCTALHNLLKNSRGIDGAQMIEDFSGLGPRALFRKLLGDSADMFKDIPNIEGKMFTGMRYAQDFYYFSERPE